jgi:hypothetical protein
MCPQTVIKTEFKMVLTTVLLGFFNFVNRPEFETTLCFRNWICFRPQVMA